LALGQVTLPSCGQDLYSDILRQHHPVLAESVETTFEHASRSGTYRTDAQLTIPVVFHVVWKETSENLPDSVLHDQVRILNNDFNQLNEDQTNLREIFQPEAGNARVTFVLDRIVRIQTDQLFKVDMQDNNLLRDVKRSDLGGSDAVDPAHHLNIWVCNIQPITFFGIEVGRILGFAFPPNDLDNWPNASGAPTPEEDGVVVDYRTVGSNNPNRLAMGDEGDMTVRGRTLTHEIGHYFGLRHIWGDGGFLGAPNDCQQTDGIADTPFANAQSSFDCDKSRNSCTGYDEHYGMDAPDLVENFMDYAKEDCMNMFTRGQAALMRNILAGPRSGLLMPVTGTGQPLAAASFDAFPNPGSGPVQVRFDCARALRAEFRLWSPDGRLIDRMAPQAFEAGTHTVTLAFEPKQPGLYYLEMASETGRNVTRIVRR
jgi:hypothetical protein